MLNRPPPQALPFLDAKESAVTPDDSPRPLLPRAFVARTLFVLGMGFLLLLSIKLSQLWVLLFGAVVVAVILRSIADPMKRFIRLPDGFAVLAAALTVLAVIGLVLTLFGYQIHRQIEELTAIVPRAWETLQARLSASQVGAWALEQGRGATGQAGRVFALAPKIAGAVASGAATLFLVLIAGVYLALEPASSRDGVASLFPISARPRMKHVMDACGTALKGWFLAQLVSMILVGTLTGVGLWALGIPSPLALGLVAGLAQFVPIVGPIIAAVPALIIAATAGTDKLALTGGLFLAVSQLESNFITPMVQRNVADLPVVFGIFAVVGFTLLFGPVGGLFATPMALVIYTLVTMLYRQDVLGDADAHAPGQEKAAEKKQLSSPE